MYYYAYYGSDYIVTGVYSLPTQFSQPGYAEINATQYNASVNGTDGSLIGMRYDPDTNTFVNPSYYYAIIDSRGVCTDVTESTTQLTGDDLIEIDSLDTTLVGKWWNGTAFVEQPPHIAAAHSTDDINVKELDVWLSDKLDDLDEDIENKADLNHTHTGFANSSHTHAQADVTGLETALAGKASSTHTHTASDVGAATASHTHPVATTSSAGFMSASDKTTLNSLTAGTNAMSADDILTAIKTVDGSNSGLDADTLDGVQASGFATASHTHSGYAASDHTHTPASIGAATANHTHTGYASTSEVSSLATTVAGKADANHTHSGYALTGHNHDTAYSAIDHTHSNYSLTTHNHDTAYSAIGHDHDDDYATIDHTHTGFAASSHTHTQSDISGLSDALDGKASTTHTHSGYASSTHTHSQSDITGLETALSGKAATNHTHSGYAATSHTHAQSDITGLSTTLSGKANASHTHTMSDVSGTLPISKGGTGSTTASSALSAIGAAASNHTHSEYASSSHTHTSFSSAINVNGAIKSNNVQVGYNSGTDTTLGSNSYPTNVAGTQVTLNGDKVYSPNIYPRNSGSFSLGAQSNRWASIYSASAVNVSSDERLKENIIDIIPTECSKFINNLDVVSFNYIGKDKENIGIIAQQLINASPELAKYLVEQGDDGYYGVKTSDLVFPLIAAFQELYKEVHK